MVWKIAHYTCFIAEHWIVFCPFKMKYLKWSFDWFFLADDELFFPYFLKGKTIATATKCRIWFTVNSLYWNDMPKNEGTGSYWIFADSSYTSSCFFWVFCQTVLTFANSGWRKQYVQPPTYIVSAVGQRWMIDWNRKWPLNSILIFPIKNKWRFCMK